MWVGLWTQRGRGVVLMLLLRYFRCLKRLFRNSSVSSVQKSGSRSRWPCNNFFRRDKICAHDSQEFKNSTFALFVLCISLIVLP